MFEEKQSLLSRGAMRLDARTLSASARLPDASKARVDTGYNCPCRSQPSACPLCEARSPVEVEEESEAVVIVEATWTE